MLCTITSWEGVSHIGTEGCLVHSASLIQEHVLGDLFGNHKTSAFSDFASMGTWLTTEVTLLAHCLISKPPSSSSW